MTRPPEVCPKLGQFAAGTVAAFFREISVIDPREKLYKVELRQMLAAHVQDEQDCYCEECMEVEALAAIVKNPAWSPSDPDSRAQFTAACDRYRAARKKRRGMVI